MALSIIFLIISTEKPSSLTAQWLTWSEYKHSNTFKLLIGVAPNGLANLFSRLWCGNASDRYIFEKDDPLPKLSPGDMVMVDKGFTVEDLLPVTVKLNMPPRIPSHRQMTTNEFFSDSRYCLGSYYSRDENRTVQNK
jgi:hypothetical protein